MGTGHTWTDEEKQFIINNSDLTGPALTKLYNEKYGTNFSLSRIKQMRKDLCGSRVHIWTEEEKQFLVNNISLKYTELAEMFNKKFNTNFSAGSIGNVCMNLSGIKRCARWTQEEDKWLLGNLSKYNTIFDCYKEFNKVFPNSKTYNAVQHRCTYLGVKTTGAKKVHQCQLLKNIILSIIKDNIHLSTKELVELIYTKTNLKLLKSRVDKYRRLLPQWDEQKAKITEAIVNTTGGRKLCYCRVPATHELYNKMYKYRKDFRYGEGNIQVLRATFNWILAGNTVPDKHILIHLDGDSLNDDVSNLRCISRQTFGKLMAFLRNENKRWGTLKYPPGFIDSILEMIKFNDKVGK